MKSTYYVKLIRVTARVLSFFQKAPIYSLKNMKADLMPGEIFKVKEAQSNLKDIKNYSRLGPKENEEGLVGNRCEPWIQDKTTI